MSRDILSRIERESVAAAGDKAGAYLDSIGITDLTKLSPEQWTEMLDTLFNSFGEEMRTRLRAGTAPF